MAIDWLRIKTEYINDQNASYRKLADKYGVNKDTIAIRAKNENWKALREEQTAYRQRPYKRRPTK